MITIYRNGESREVSMTEYEFSVSLLPGKGWTLTDTYVPQSVTMRQARLMLLKAGLLPAVEAAVASLGQAAQITWDVSSAVERSNPLIVQVAAATGMTSAQIDQMFREAAKL